MPEFSRRFAPALFLLLQMPFSASLAQTATPAAGSAALAPPQPSVAAPQASAAPKVADVQTNRGEAKPAAVDSNASRTVDEGGTLKLDVSPLFLHQGSLEIRTPKCAAAFIASKGACGQ